MNHQGRSNSQPIPAIASNVLETLKRALRNGSSVNVRDPNEVYSLFEVACSTPGTKDLIKSCIECGALVAEINPNTNEYPIHIAALSEDCENLSALLESPRVVIDQKFEDRTALFLLFEQLSGDNYEKVFECIKLLLKHGANINTTDENSVSPIAKLVEGKERWRKDILEYCFKHYGVNVDYRNQQARKLIEKNFPDVTIPYYDMENITVEVLRSKLSASVEDDFLKAFRKFGAQKGALADNDFKDLLSLAVYRSKLEAAKMLVEPKMNNGTLLDAPLIVPGLLAKCCNRGNVEMLQWLLSIIPRNEIGLINERALLSLLVKQIDASIDKNKCPYFKIMELLLEDGRIDIDKLGTSKRTALHYAVKYKIDHAQELLLSKGASVSVVDMFSELPISDMDPFLLEKHLDSCVSSNDKKPGDKDFEVKIDFSNFVSPALKTGYSCDYEMLPILRMAQYSDMKHLLRHPVISSILLLKWFKLSVFFYINLLLCTVLFVSFIAYAVFYHERDDGLLVIRTTSLWLSGLSLVCLLLREVSQMAFNKLDYLRSLENYMEIALIVAAFWVLLFSPSEGYRQVISALVIIMIAFELTLLMAMLPRLSISTHMVMLKTVSKNFLKCLVVYFIILIAFTFSFYTLFRESDNRQSMDDSEKFRKFHDISFAFIKVAVMLTGELEASSFEFRDFNCVVFALFLFFIPIVLYNLINGLAVSDIAEIKAKSEIIGLTEKVFLINKHENAIKTLKRITNILNLNSIQCLCSTRRCSLFPKTVPHQHIIIKPNISNAIWIPPPEEKESMELTTIQSDATSEFESSQLGGSMNAVSVEFNHMMDGKIVKYALNILYPFKRHRDA